MWYVVSFAVAGVLLAVEYQLCVKFKSLLVGGIIPMAILAAAIVVFAVGKMLLEGRYIFPFVVLNTIFFAFWGDCRKKRLQKQQEEMEKMKAQDI